MCEGGPLQRDERSSLQAPPTPAQMFHTFDFIREPVVNVTPPCGGAIYLHGARENYVKFINAHLRT